jgi:hypothetical protein
MYINVIYFHSLISFLGVQEAQIFRRMTVLELMEGIEV